MHHKRYVVFQCMNVVTCTFYICVLFKITAILSSFLMQIWTARVV